MTETKLPLEPLQSETVGELIRATGPCITLVLPPYRPGEPEQTAAALLKTSLQDAQRQLAARKIAEPQIRSLLEPLERLVSDQESLAGSHAGRVIFRSPAIFRQIELPERVELHESPAGASLVIGAGFHIRPILTAAALPGNIYVLAVTKRDVTLLRCAEGRTHRVELPKGTPQTLSDALAFDAPDHDLVNRSASGPSTGSMQGVRFGTGSGRETQHAYLADFYKAVDRGVNEILRSSQAPLLLAGVGEDVVMYRSSNTYPHLLRRNIPAGPSGPMSQIELLRHANDAVRFDFQERTALELAVSKERLGPTRFLTDLVGILQAAVEGRVSDVYLDENGQKAGAFEARLLGGTVNWRDEDLLNVAAIETLQRGGAAYSLPSHLMPEGALAAAILRY